MANRRMISKRISVSTRVSALSDFSKLLYTWMIPHVDDWGRIDGEPKKIKAMIMPLSEHPVKKFEKAIEEMAKVGLIHWYFDENEVFIEIVGFEDHQTGLEKRSKSKYPNLPQQQEKLYPSENFLEILRTSEKFLLNLTKPNLTKLNLTKPPIAFNFEEVWNQYPKKIGRKEAEKHFLTSVLTDKDFADILAAVKKYTKHSRDLDEKFIQHGSTWFNNWRDWIPEPPKTPKVIIPKAKDEPAAPMPEDTKKALAGFKMRGV